MARIKRLDPQPVTPNLAGNHSSHLNDSWWSIKQTNDLLTSTIGKGVGEGVNFYGKIVDDPIAERVTNGILMKGWRALLFTNRAGITHQINTFGEKENILPDNKASMITYQGRARTKDLHNLNQLEFDRERGLEKPILVGHSASEIYYKAQQYGLDVHYNDLTGNTLKFQENSNRVRIWNLIEENYITLQLRPKEIEAKPETSWAAIKSMGRNLPMYHYLGGEDTLQFNIDWFLSGRPEDGEPFNPYYVINQCRRLKSWTFANSYTAAPPILAIEWGVSDIFEDELWILTSATYHLSDFRDTVVRKYNTMDKEDNTIPNKYVDIVNSGLLPFSATQELIFKRVDDHNLFSSEIYHKQNPQNT